MNDAERRDGDDSDDTGDDEDTDGGLDRARSVGVEFLGTAAGAVLDVL
jgi:hypothetical protein